MSEDQNLSISRPLAAAATLAHVAQDAGRFHTKRVLLGGDAQLLSTTNGACAFLAALRLLTRICSNVTVSLAPELSPFGDVVAREARRIAFGKPIVLNSGADPREFDAVLLVANRAPADCPVTLISSNGWIARVSSTGGLADDEVHKFNPIAAWAAASLGVADVFKKLVCLKDSRGPLFDDLSFSLFTYETGTDDPGPEIPHILDLDMLLVGCGAIGNGVIGVIHDFELEGRLVVLDRQVFGEENLGTCVMLDRGFLGRAKTDIASLVRDRNPRLDVTPIEGEVPSALSRLATQPKIVCNGLDNPLARRAVQHIWANQTIDGAIGDFMCQVGVHPGDPRSDVACLRCTVPEPNGANWEDAASRASGLAPLRVLNMSDVVNESDVDAAPPRKRDFLRSHIGRKICSVVDAETLASISDTDDKDFAPSVPFVATMSAAMVVGELIRVSLGYPPVLTPRYQFDMLVGPAAGMFFSESRHIDCDCVTRRALIEELRKPFL